MTPLVISLWIANVSLDTIGQVAFKYAAISSKNEKHWHYWLNLFSNYWLWLGISAYLIEFFLWLAFLTLVPLSKSILLSSINIITIMLVGRLLFRETLTAFRIIGMVLITVGVVFVGTL